MARGSCFTPNSARRELQRVRPAAERMCRLYQELERRKPEGLDSDQSVEKSYFHLLLHLYTIIAEIGRHGVRVRDVRLGSLDFPARRQGRAVMLCWRVGESGVGFWHEPDAGHDGRRPVEDDGQWEPT